MVVKNKIGALEILAIIPARGGSEGIHRKNVQPLGGKPLLAHTIDAAKDAKFVKRIVVSTDDQEISSVAKTYGADVIWRPRELSNSKSSSESALLHALESLQSSENYIPEILVFLQCTSPLRSAADIDGAVQTLFEKNADTVLAVTPFHSFIWEYDKGGNAVGINHDKSFRKMRQDQTNQYLETGAVYILKVAGFIEARHRFFGNTATFIIPKERSVEIDEPIDLLIAEHLLRNSK